MQPPKNLDAACYQSTASACAWQLSGEQQLPPSGCHCTWRPFPAATAADLLLRHITEQLMYARHYRHTTLRFGQPSSLADGCTAQYHTRSMTEIWNHAISFCAVMNNPRCTAIAIGVGKLRTWGDCSRSKSQSCSNLAALGCWPLPTALGAFTKDRSSRWIAIVSITRL